MDWVMKIGMAILGLVPLSMLVVGAVDMTDAVRFNLAAVETEAEVIGVKGATRGRVGGKTEVGSSTYPELKYKTAEGEEMVALGWSSMEAELTVRVNTGDVVAARYDPANPTDIRLEGPWMLYAGPGKFLLFGVVFTGIIGLVAYAMSRP